MLERYTHWSVKLLQRIGTYLLRKGKYHFTSADLLFYLFRFSCFAYVKLTTDLLVWLNPNQSIRRLSLQWYFPLQSKWVLWNKFYEILKQAVRHHLPLNQPPFHGDVSKNAFLGSRLCSMALLMITLFWSHCVLATLQLGFICPSLFIIIGRCRLFLFMLFASLFC